MHIAWTLRTQLKRCSLKALKIVEKIIPTEKNIAILISHDLKKTAILIC